MTCIYRIELLWYGGVLTHCHQYIQSCTTQCSIDSMPGSTVYMEWLFFSYSFLIIQYSTIQCPLYSTVLYVRVSRP